MVTRFTLAFLLVPVLAIGNPGRGRAVTIETVPVGNPGNAADVQANGAFGAVAYNFRMGKYEVTNAQYLEFLNIADPQGNNSLALYDTVMNTSANGGIRYNFQAAPGAR